jgi:hypothetical protein
MIFAAALPIKAQTRFLGPSANRSLTGEYRSRNPNDLNMLWITDLPKGRIHFCLYAGFLGPMGGIHSGYAQADIEVKDSRVVYVDNNETYQCTIVMTFSAGKVELKQQGGCGFGYAVTAGGSYRRTSAKVPKDDSCKERGLP